jgi:LPXTG-motif cell wall-anchored protein
LQDNTARPGGRDGSTPLMMALAGVVLGLIVFIGRELLGSQSSPYNVIPYVLIGALLGFAASFLRRRRRRHGAGDRP